MTRDSQAFHLQSVSIHTSYKEYFNAFIQAVMYAPLPVFALITYVSLKSSIIHPYAVTGRWQDAYFGWWDIMLGLSIILHFILRKIASSQFAIFAVLTLLASTVLSHLGTNLFFSFEASRDALIYSFRFAFVFLFIIDLVQNKGLNSALSVFLFLFVELVVSSWFVASLRGEDYYRLYASAVSISFTGQMSALVFLLAYINRLRFLALISCAVMVMTVSYTAIFTLGTVIIIYAFYINRSVLKYIFRVIMVVIVILSGLYLYYATARTPSQASAVTRLQKTILTLNNRLPLWEYCTQSILNGKIGMLGAGQGRVPEILQKYRSSQRFNSFAWHSHSIFFEGLIGLGILFLPIIGQWLYRFITYWNYRIYLSGVFGLMFVITQMVDFNVMAPKEIVMWAIVLGIAEGNFYSVQTQTDPVES